MYEPAAQLERTALSWNRSLFALAANGLLLIKAGSGVGWWAIVLGLLVLVLCVGLWFGVRRAYRTHRGTPSRTLLLHGRVGPTVVALLVAVAVADLVVVAVHP